MRPAAILPLLAQSLLLALSAFSPAQEVDPGYRAYLWTEPDLFRQTGLRQALESLGFHGVSAEPGDDLKPLLEAGVPFYLDQVLDGEVLHLREETFARALAASREVPPGLDRPRCLNRPEVLDEARSRIVERLSLLGAARPEFISLRDEISYTRFINPIDWCRDRPCQAAFAAFLNSRWGPLDRLQAAWGTPADGEVLVRVENLGGRIRSLVAIPTTDEARRRFFHAGRPAKALVAWNDAREFADATLSEALRALRQPVQDLLPGVPVGFLGGQMPSAFGGFDWEKLLPWAAVVEPYDHGGTREIVRSLRVPGSRVLHTIFRRGSSSLAAVHELYHYFLHGDQGSIIFSAADVFEEGDPSRPTAWARSLAPHLRLLSSPQLADFRRGEEPPAQVAVLCSMPSIRAHWMLDTQRDGAGWTRRLTSYEIVHSTQARTRQSWISILEDLGLTYQFVTPAQIRGGVLASRSPGALVLPRAIALSQEEVTSIRRFAEGGALVVADCQAGLFNSRLEEASRSPLDDLFRVRRRDHATNLDGDRIRPGCASFLPYPVAEPSLESAGASPERVPGGVPVLLGSTVGPTLRGRTLYLNLLVMNYAADRLTNPERARWLLEQLRPHFLHAGLRPLVHLEHRDESASWPVETTARRVAGRMSLAFQINLRAGTVEIPWKSVEEAPDVAFEARLWGTFRVHDPLSGEDLGMRTSIPVRLRPDRPAFFVVDL